MKGRAFPDLRGKAVLFHRRQCSITSLLKNVSLKTYAGRLFVAGTVPAGGSSNDWAKGVTILLAWDEIAEYAIFDSAADYRRRTGPRGSRRRPSGSPPAGGHAPREGRELGTHRD